MFWCYVIAVHLKLYWCLIYWQWKKIVLRKAWVTSVAFTFIDWKQTVEKNCSQESMGHECSLYVYQLKTNSGKKLFSGKHGSWVSPLPLLIENEQYKRLFPQKHVRKVKMDCETHQNPCWRPHLEISSAFVVHIVLLMFPMLHGVFLFKPLTLANNTT
jgi:hypothetical protein